jgi:hypothetical protein
MSDEYVLVRYARDGRLLFADIYSDMVGWGYELS